MLWSLQDYSMTLLATIKNRMWVTGGFYGVAAVGIKNNGASAF